MMPLSMAEHGKELEIKRINGKDDTRRFLETLGFVEGSKVRIVSENGWQFDCQCQGIPHCN